jgi:hypothetical protein
MACAICNIRREKRACPGVRGQICAICCGEQREETISCPLDCEYLQIAHRKEALEKKDPAGVPNADVRIERDFLRKNAELITSLQHALLLSAFENDAIDSDIKEALDGLFKTYKTLDSGLFYESRPANPIAAAIFAALQNRVTGIRQAEGERGMHKITDSQIRSVLVLLQHMEYAFNNGRRKGRCFIHNLRTSLAGVADPQQAQRDPASLIVS